jgi:hypothetical protein
LTQSGQQIEQSHKVVFSDCFVSVAAKNAMAASFSTCTTHEEGFGFFAECNAEGGTNYDYLLF